MKKTTLLLSFLALYLCSHAQGGTWTWVNGDQSINGPGNIGTINVPNAANYPPGRYQSINWIDQNGNFWIFGGVVNSGGDEMQDLWKYNPNTNVWTWVKGPSIPGGVGVYGTQGVPAPGNIPGGRGWGAVSWTDHQGHLWMHGGYGYDATGFIETLDDMWMYDIATNQWTWMAGSNIGGGVPTYGTLQVGAAANTPG
ncbi:MAG: Kelch repeat type 2-containing protein, partial [Bacteroidetes bacterium]|nr:Kelch repeat type 2-containing protein [Bacteroidota bacterium]